MASFRPWTTQMETQIKPGYFVLAYRMGLVAASLLAVGSLLAHLVGYSREISFLFSARGGRKRRRNLIFFLVLAAVCFVSITTARYAAHSDEFEAIVHDAEAAAAKAWKHPDDVLHDLQDKAHELGAKFTSVPDVHLNNRNAKGDRTPQPILDSKPGRVYAPLHSNVDVNEFTPASPYHPLKEDLPFSRWLNDKLPVESAFDTEAEANGWITMWRDPAHYWWVQQWHMGAIAWAPYVGWQARLRALPWSTPLIFIFLASQFSFAGAQSLLYALLLVSPVRDSNLERWTPTSAILLVPAYAFIGVTALLPAAVGWEGSVYVHKLAEYTAYFLGFAVAWFHPARLGSYHLKPYYAQQIRKTLYFWLTVPILALHLYATFSVIFTIDYSSHNRWWLLGHHNWRFSRKSTPDLEDLRQGAGLTFGALARPAAINSTCWDVILSGVVLASWAITHELEARHMLRCTLMPWLQDWPYHFKETEHFTGRAVETSRRPQPTPSAQPTIRRTPSGRAMPEPSWLDRMTQFARPMEAPTTATEKADMRNRGRVAKHTYTLSDSESGYTASKLTQDRQTRTSSRKFGTSPAKGRPGSRSRSRGRAVSAASGAGGKDTSGKYYKGFTAAAPLEEGPTGWEAAGVLWCLGVVGGLGVACVGAAEAEMEKGW
nr:hypothetical protein B0A51_12302 [Rachicladosporium sp. CCFEE 5018]